MKELEQIIDTIKLIREKITDDTDVAWAGYNSPAELNEEIDRELAELKKGKLEKLEIFQYHFLPTSTFQDLSISNGWREEYIELAEVFDILYDLVKKKIARK